MKNKPRIHPEIQEGIDELKEWDKCFFDHHPDQTEYTRKAHPVEVLDHHARTGDQITRMHVRRAGYLRFRTPIVVIERDRNRSGSN